MRDEMPELINSWRQRMIYVTHDQVEAMTMADRIVALMRSGRVAAGRHAAWNSTTEPANRCSSPASSARRHDELPPRHARAAWFGYYLLSAQMVSG
jgi:ABC-type nitrate/sulfonate/bicarbonate transport system ATPase subunit